MHVNLRVCSLTLLFFFWVCSCQQKWNEMSRSDWEKNGLSVKDGLPLIITKLVTACMYACMIIIQIIFSPSLSLVVPLFTLKHSVSYDLTLRKGRHLISYVLSTCSTAHAYYHQLDYHIVTFPFAHCTVCLHKLKCIFIPDFFDTSEHQTTFCLCNQVRCSLFISLRVESLRHRYQKLPLARPLFQCNPIFIRKLPSYELFSLTPEQ